MKKIHYLSSALFLAGLSLFSCSKEMAEDEKESTDNNRVFLKSIFATLEGQEKNTLRTKLVQDGETFKLSWNIGDKIVVGDGQHSAYYQNSSSDSSKFEFVSGEALNPEKGLMAFYPSTAETSQNHTQIFFDFTADSIQPYTDKGLLAENVYPMLATVDEEGKAKFMNLFSVLRINVKPANSSEDYAVKSITLRRASGADLSGNFTCTFSTIADKTVPTIVSTSSANNSVTLLCKDPVKIGSGKIFYIAVPYGSYTGLQVQVNLSNNYSYIDSPRPSKFFERSKYYTTSIAVGAPSEKVRECVDLGIASGRLWATCNVGGNNVTDCGGFYAYGEVQEKSSYTWTNYKFIGDNKKYACEGGLMYLENEDDAAYVNWGPSWGTPDYNDFADLLRTCSWEYVNNYKGSIISGRLATSKVNHMQLFFPSVGFKVDSRWPGDTGYYMAKNCNSDNSNGVFEVSESIVTYDFKLQVVRNGINVRAVTTRIGK